MYTPENQAEQAYFWTPEWQAKERAAEQAIAEGRVRTFDTMDEMLNFLNAQMTCQALPKSAWHVTRLLPPRS